MFEIGFWRCITCLYNDTYDHAVRLVWKLFLKCNYWKSMHFMYFVGGVVGLEEEYHKALAENIVKELSQPKLRKESTLRGRAPSRDSAKSGKRVIRLF